LLFVTRRTSGIGRRMESIVASLKSRNRGRIVVRKLDADRQPELMERLQVRQIPSFLFVRDRKLVKRLEGRTTLEELERVLARFR
jgi:thioredoxin-like negative regulator of GroEL